MDKFEESKKHVCWYEFFALLRHNRGHSSWFWVRQKMTCLLPIFGLICRVPSGQMVRWIILKCVKFWIRRFNCISHQKTTLLVQKLFTICWKFLQSCDNFVSNYGLILTEKCDVLSHKVYAKSAYFTLVWFHGANNCAFHPRDEINVNYAFFNIWCFDLISKMFSMFWKNIKYSGVVPTYRTMFLI